ncbi:MAG: hypothetical protein WBQ43_21105 [Terriglobales bacterium]
MQTVRLFLVMVLVIAPALAESHRSEDVSGEPAGEINTTRDNSTSSNSASGNATAAYTPAVASPVSLPDAPARQRVKVRVVDKKFIAVMGALGGAESLRLTTHQLVLVHEYDAGAPWVRSVPANRRLVSEYGGIYLAELLVVYELKKPHSWLPGDKIIRKIWWAYPAAMAPVHIMNGVRSIRTQASSLCPAAECQ